MRKLKIGLDLHGVVDDKSDLFSVLTKTLFNAEHEIHIITGSYITPELTEEIIEEYKISFTHLFSILDYHKNIGTPIQIDENGQSWIEGELWGKTKAEYCERMDIDLHLDDSDVYGRYFNTPYARLYTKNKCTLKK